jgi:AcrR family transcriptional regulator
MMSPATTTARPLRQDAARNRDRLLAAASQVFDAQGLDASVADIARVAGVGMGTLYRRFPTKDALIEALVREILDATIRMAREAADQPDGAGLERFLETFGAYQAEHCGCLPKLWKTDHDLVRTARRLIANLLTDAQQHNRIRSDLTSTDLTMVMWSIRSVLENTRHLAPDAWRRHLDLLIAGMRPETGDLPHRPLTQSKLDQILATPAGAGTTRLPFDLPAR